MKSILSDLDLEKILHGGGKKLIVFSADWCGPCKTLKSNLKKVSGEISNVEMFIADVSETKDHTNFFSIKSIPVCILLDREKEIARFTGVKTPDQIKKFITDHNN
jgi:thioredoxin 1